MGFYIIVLSLMCEYHVVSNLWVMRGKIAHIKFAEELALVFIYLAICKIFPAPCSI